MDAWGKDQGVDGQFIKMYGDPHSVMTRACDMELIHDGPKGKGLINRCKRHVLVVDDGEVKFAAIAEDPEFDPAGDDFPEATLAPAVLEFLK